MQEKTINLKSVKVFPVGVQIFFNIITCGLYFILTKMFYSLFVALRHYKCTPEDATHIVIYKNSDKKVYQIKDIKMTKKYILLLEFINTQNIIRVLDTEYGRFVFNCKKNMFILPSFSDVIINKMCEEEKRCVFGENIIEPEILSFYDIVSGNIFELNFFWEISTACIWLAIEYHKYFIIVSLIYLTLFVKNMFEEIKENDNRRKAFEAECSIQIHKKFDTGYRLVNRRFIYPGDVILIKPTKALKCDARIISGDVITNEAFLTGESVPVCKGKGEEVYLGTEIMKSCNDTKESKGNNNLHTKLVRIKNLLTNSNKEIKYKPKLNDFNYEDIVYNYAVAKVTATGRRTKNGQLIKNVFLRAPIKDKFKQQTFKTSIILMGVSLLVALGYSFYLNRYICAMDTFLYCFDVVATVFSPTLIVCAEFNILRAISRLKTIGIHTNDKDRIVVAGNVDTVVFDKTGTLTEIGLEIKEVDRVIHKIENPTFFYASTDKDTFLLRMGMSTCHQVVEINGEYSGDVLDMKMFLFSNCEIFTLEKIKHVRYKTEEEMEEKKFVKEYSNKRTENKNRNDYTLFLHNNKKNLFKDSDTSHNTTKILKIFEFNSIDKRMSVIVEHDGKYFVFCKGAPEILAKIISNLDDSYDTNFKKHSISGYRTLTLCYKDITDLIKTKDINQILRNECENELKFLGFLVFANNLKKETKDVINQLKNADINVRMCTGDSVLTAISVGKESGMIQRDMPILFPVVVEGSESEDDAGGTFFDVNNATVEYDWVCVADDDYVFDKNKLELYLEYDDDTEIDYAVAVEGREYYEMIKDAKYKELMLNKGVIFARFTPDGKKHLVEQFINNSKQSKKTVVFCGDGANDAGALCAATVGILLTNDVTTRISSFTSQKLDSVLSLIKEGRSALVLGMSQFKYIFYSQILSGLTMCVTLISHNFPSDGQSLIVDLISCYGLGNILLLLSYDKLCKKKIKINTYKHCALLTLELLLIVLVYFVAVLVFVPSEETLESFKQLALQQDSGEDNEIIEVSNQATVLFYLTMFAYINKIFYFSFDVSGIKLLRNYKFMGIMFGIIAFLIVLLLDNLNEWGLMYMKMDFTNLTTKEMVVMLVSLVVVGGIVNGFNFLVKNTEYY